MKKFNKNNTTLYLFCFLFNFFVLNLKAQNNDLDFGIEWKFERGFINSQLFENEIGQAPKLQFSAESFTLEHSYINEVIIDDFIELNELEQTFELFGSPFMLLGFQSGDYVTFMENHYGIYYINENLEEARNPFSYSITLFDGYKELTITNNQGDWAVYSTLYLSAETFTAGAFSISPNPVKDILYVQNHQNLQNLSIQVCDSNGRIIMTKNLKNSKQEIDIHHLDTGIYFLVIESEEGFKTTQKFVKI